MDDGKLEQREVSPGEEAVGSIPRIRAGLLRAEDGVVNVEIESLVAVGAGVGVGAHEHVSFAEVVAERNLQGVVTIFTCVLKEVISAGAVVESVVDESAGAATVEELRFQIDCCGKLLFEAEAPVEKTRHLECIAVNGEGRGNGAGGDDAVGGTSGDGDGVEDVFARARVGTGDQVDGSGVVDKADSGGEFGVTGTAEDVGSGEARREDGVANDFVPVKADAGCDQKAIGDEPAIFGIGADFGIELLVPRGGAESGVAGAWEF